jgi:phenylalanyl-tRNA synthetase alpha chain
VRSQYRKIFTNMGFTEMPTNNYVESSFWNFDSLFQPQQHPARDAHDTFFLTSPATSDTFPEDYLQRVKVGRCVGLCWHGVWGAEGMRNGWRWVGVFVSYHKVCVDTGGAHIPDT